MTHKIKNTLYLLPFLFFEFVQADGLIEIVNGVPQVVKPSNTSNDTWNGTLTVTTSQLFKFYRVVWGISIILTVICLVIGAVQLSAAAGNPMKKQKAWGRIKTSIIVIACLGGILTIVGFAFSFLR